MGEVIQGLWLGTGLSQMEVLSIRSFLELGHEYHLYAYQDLANVPAGVQLVDASRILPYDPAFRYRDSASPACFSNLFRYKLLLERGGYWADLDVICLRPWRFRDPYVFSWSGVMEGGLEINTHVMRAPPGSDLMAALYRSCRGADPTKMVWGGMGPKVLTEAVGRFGLTRYAKPKRYFNPIDWWNWKKLVSARRRTRLWGRYWVLPRSYALHCYNECWRRHGADKDGDHHPGSIYETLKRRYPPPRGGRAAA